MEKKSGLTGLGKAVMATFVAVILGGGFWFINNHTTWLQRSTTLSTVPDVKPMTGPAFPRTPLTANSNQAAANTSTKVVAGGCTHELWTIPWNATMGPQYANGGVETVEGSLMAQNGVKLKLVRQDDYGKMQESMLRFAEGVGKGESCPQGAAFVVIMGDGYSGFASGLAEQMSKLKQGFAAVTAVGYSAGEDKCMLPYEVAKDPQKARGMTVAAVPRDGDMNICLVWASQNNIPFNADAKTYDPNSLNIIETDSFAAADEKYITGYCEQRSVVRGGKVTSEKAQVCANGTATWTPGDVNVAQKKGGLAAVASTREYAYQMPAIIIGNRDYMKRNPKLVEGLIRAAHAGSDRVNADDSALTLGSKVSAQVYGEQDTAYWKKYFHGVVENDAKGVPIHLGGSRVNGLADAAFLFGLNGNDNLYRRNYEMFGNMNARFYPTITPTFPSYDQVVDTSYLASVIKSTPAAQMSAKVTPNYDANRSIDRVIGKRNWTIEFDTNKATIRPESDSVLAEMLNLIAITNLQVEVRGHTDSVGSYDSNMKLSRARAEAVKAYLMTNASSGFPSERIRTLGFGDTRPVADNATVEGKSKNRRVEIILGTTGG